MKKRESFIGKKNKFNPILWTFSWYLLASYCYSAIDSLYEGLEGCYRVYNSIGTNVSFGTTRTFRMICLSLFWRVVQFWMHDDTNASRWVKYYMSLQWSIYALLIDERHSPGRVTASWWLLLPPFVCLPWVAIIDYRIISSFIDN
jgi:hypothetical protein